MLPDHLLKFEFALTISIYLFYLYWFKKSCHEKYLQEICIHDYRDNPDES
jgi:hypothetical protein